jgi:hypothetical protein
VLGMARQVDFAISADDPPVTLDQDRRVLAIELAVFLCHPGIARKDNPAFPGRDQKQEKHRRTFF